MGVFSETHEWHVIILHCITPFIVTSWINNDDAFSDIRSQVVPAVQGEAGDAQRLHHAHHQPEAHLLGGFIFFTYVFFVLISFVFLTAHRVRTIRSCNRHYANIVKRIQTDEFFTNYSITDRNHFR